MKRLLIALALVFAVNCLIAHEASPASKSGVMNIPDPPRP